MKPSYYVQFTSDLEYETRYATLKGAQEAAEELAASNPGDHIEILKCVGISSCSSPSTFWMDEEEPAEDLREFEFYRNDCGTIFWRVSKRGVEIACHYGDGYMETWERSQKTLPQLRKSATRIEADELPEELV
jgi:hypothetical protein